MFKKDVMTARSKGSALWFIVPLLSSSPAFAEAACGDSTCPRGFSCVTELVQSCPAIDCEGTCPPCAPPKLESFCKAEPCASDSDCDKGMVCSERSEEAFGAEPTCEGADCRTREGAVATDSTPVKYCVARWRLSCSTAADCGDGFECVDQERCSCPGSGSGEGSSSDPTPARLQETCSCEPTGHKACQVVEVDCTGNADCAFGFTCEPNPGASCASSSDGSTTCDPGTPPTVCIPPYPDLTRVSDGSPAVSPGSTFNDSTHRVEGATQKSNGCSVAHPGRPGSAASLLVLLGAAFGFARRRRR